MYYDEITVIGTFNGYSPRFFVKDNNLRDFPEYLKKFKIIVTFNGKLFDVPFIKKAFPNIEIPKVHIDLRFLLHTIGLYVPLKEIEKQIDFVRPGELKDVGGREAVILWHQYLKGDSKSIEDLLLYNAHDVVNLKRLLFKFAMKKT